MCTQDCVWLFRKGAHRALALGLGVGFAVQSLQDRGVVVDVMELHEEVWVRWDEGWVGGMRDGWLLLGYEVCVKRDNTLTTCCMLHKC